jgi:lysyl endopeptidase
VRLADRAPEEAWFSGWDAAPLPFGVPVLGLHHPAGDLKKVSFGSALDATLNASGTRYSTIAWSFGSTEGGSSGSGIFTLSGGEYVLRGGLRGGSASCATTGRVDNLANRDYYSRLEAEAQALRTWLSAKAAPAEDYTDLWWNPAEPGAGVTILQRPNNRVYLTWYTYDADGEPTWFVVPESAWRSTTVLEGALYRTRGSAYDQRHDDAKFAVAAAGSARIEFAARDRAMLTLTLEGRTYSKPLRRQEF